MTTMYIGASHTMQRGYYLGDVFSCIKAAWLFAGMEQPDHVIVSLHRRDPLSAYWWRFLQEHGAGIVWDDWPLHDQCAQWDAFSSRRRERQVSGIGFDTYKELYPRLDGGMRQNELCGGQERGLGRANIFEYYYYGQEAVSPDGLQGSLEFGRGLIDVPAHCPARKPSCFVAPWEKCQGNVLFTADFWRRVILILTSKGIHVTINDDRNLFHELPGMVTRVYPSLLDLPAVMSRHDVVLCGNTGPGWVAGAGEYPLVVAESDHMHFGEYGFAKCGFRSLRHRIAEPDVDQMVRAAVEVIDAARHGMGG